MLKLDDAGRLSSLEAWSRYNLPYAFQRLPNFAGQVWLPLNRNYKPLGQIDDVFVNYDDFVSRAVGFARDPRLFRDIWHGTLYENTLYLYNDGSESRVDYFVRLERLFGYTLKPSQRR